MPELDTSKIFGKPTYGTPSVKLTSVLMDVCDLYGGAGYVITPQEKMHLKDSVEIRVDGCPLGIAYTEPDNHAAIKVLTEALEEYHRMTPSGEPA